MASWITAIAALLAVLLAGGALAVVRAMHLALLRRFTMVEQWYGTYRGQLERNQAELVCAWPVSERETYERVITRGVVGVAVRNASEMPVYDLEIIYRDPEAAWTAVKHVHHLPPSETPDVYPGFDHEQTVGEPDPSRINSDGTIRLAHSADMRVELRFTDTHGKRWVRDEHGSLSPAVVG